MSLANPEMAEKIGRRNGFDQNISNLENFLSILSKSRWGQDKGRNKTDEHAKKPNMLHANVSILRASDILQKVFLQSTKNAHYYLRPKADRF